MYSRVLLQLHKVRNIGVKGLPEEITNINQQQRLQLVEI